MKRFGPLISFAYQASQVSMILENWDSDMMDRNADKTASAYLFLMNVEPGLMRGTGATGVDRALTIGSYMHVRNGGM